jgi:hypothetical protein
MKRAFFLMLLMLLASSAWGAVKVYPDDGEGNFKTYGLAGGGGASVALANIADWIRASGLVTSDGMINMSGLVNSDSFDDSSIDPMWNTVTAASGTIVETTEIVLTSGSSSDGSLLCYAHDLTRTNNYRVRITAKSSPSNSGYYTMLVDKSGTPVIASLATFALDLRAFQFDTGGLTTIAYNSSHTLQYWWQDSATLWQSSANATHSDIDRDEVWTFELENDGTTIFQRGINNTTDVIYAQAYRAWADMESETNEIWLCFGDAYSDAVNGVLTIYNFEHYGDYLTTSPVATMGQITVGAEIKRLGLFVSCESGGTITWRYDIGAGWVTPASGTLSDLETALVGTSPATLNLEAAFNSNGTANCDLYSDGASITTD